MSMYSTVSRYSSTQKLSEELKYLVTKDQRIDLGKLLNKIKTGNTLILVDRISQAKNYKNLYPIVLLLKVM